MSTMTEECICEKIIHNLLTNNDESLCNTKIR